MWAKTVQGSAGGSSGKYMAFITNKGAEGGCYTLFAPDFSIVKSVKLVYNSASDVDDDFVTITGTRQSDSMTIKKKCTKYHASSSYYSQGKAVYYPLTESESIAAGTVISNFYSNAIEAFYVFD